MSTDPLDPMGAPPGGKPAKKSGGGIIAKENRRAVAGAIIGGVGAIFAILNFDKVEVNWIFGSWQTPLVIVIAVSFLLGAAAGYFASQRRTKRKS
jgi:uncharacterized integral membrane protein